MHVNVDAIVLKAELLSEKDKRVCLFAREKGKLFARASGARGPAAKLAAATEPTARSRFRLWLPEGAASGRITGGALVSGYPGLRGQWERLTSALFLCEWTDRMTAPCQPSPEKFDLLTAALDGLQSQDPLLVRGAFLVQFARHAGYGPVPGVRGEGLDEWDFVSPMTCPGAAGVESQVIQFLSPLLGRPLASLAQHRTLTAFARKRTNHENISRHHISAS